MASSTEYEAGKKNSEIDFNSIKFEPDERKMFMEQHDPMEPIENKDIPHLKGQKIAKRRHSLRIEEARATKPKPGRYDETLSCYRKKEYKECIIHIDLVAETTKDILEYQILKATCLVNLQKIPEAHMILDGILRQRPTNAYCIYSKGLACYQDLQYEQAINFFKRAIELDPSGMQRAEALIKLAQRELEAPEMSTGDESSDDQMEFDRLTETSKDSSDDQMIN